MKTIELLILFLLASINPWYVPMVLGLWGCGYVISSILKGRLDSAPLFEVVTPHELERRKKAQAFSVRRCVLWTLVVVGCLVLIILKGG
jgi:hypothetical protein